jgi:hypothetical protein
MKVSILLRIALSVSVALAILAGCGGPSGPVPQGPMAQSGAQTAPGVRPASSESSYLYVAIPGDVDVLTYPDGKRLREISKYGPMCIDRNNGKLYISNGTDVDEYSPGGATRIAYVSFPQSEQEYSSGCSVDPITGDVAVMMNQEVKGVWTYYVNVYTNLQHSPATYSDPNIIESEYCDYDNQGNLFIDGASNAGSFELAELPKGEKTFADISVNLKVRPSVPLQWDGTYITVENPPLATLYRIAISGSSGTVVGTVRLTGERGHREYTSIGGNILFGGHWVVGQKRKNYGVGFWHYPAGGRAYKIIDVLRPGGHDTVTFVAASIAPSGTRIHR